MTALMNSPSSTKSAVMMLMPLSPGLCDRIHCIIPGKALRGTWPKMRPWSLLCWAGQKFLQCGDVSLSCLWCSPGISCWASQDFYLYFSCIFTKCNEFLLAFLHNLVWTRWNIKKTQKTFSLHRSQLKSEPPPRLSDLNWYFVHLQDALEPFMHYTPRKKQIKWKSTLLSEPHQYCMCPPQGQRWCFYRYVLIKLPVQPKGKAAQLLAGSVKLNVTKLSIFIQNSMNFSWEQRPRALTFLWLSLGVR